ncbi:MAG: PAS domain S-box protein [bacterium]|nr:PAS domain S-box protein [bacterium]
MDSSHDSRRLGLFLPLRLASYVILMSVVVVWMDDPQYLRFQTIIYSILTLAFAVSLGLEKKYPLKGVTYVLIGLQSLLEISIESGVIYATGNVNSPFSALFVLTIVSAALVYRMVGTLVVASLVSLAYAFIIWLGLTGSPDSELSMQALKTIFVTHESVFYAIFLHILIFYLTAFISGYLAERLNSQDRQLVDASLALKRARLETDDILRHLNSGLLTIDSGGYIIYFNRAAERILGYSEERVRGMPCSEVFAERMPALAEYLMSGINSRVTYPRKELEIVTESQGIMPLGLSSSILTEESGGLRGVIAIFSDLTEAKRMENKVRANDRLAAVGELSASIAHEIRNPLAAISGSVEVLNSELQLSNENARLMELIVKESHRLNVILSDFLSFARVSRPGYNKVELCHLVSDVRELLRLHEGTPDNIEVSFESNESIVYVIGDEDHIKQMLVNLALNSCEAFEGRPGKLLFGIRTNAAEGTVDLYIRDNGPGIDGKIMDKIFEPFYSTKKQGTGLGLAIVHRICEALKLKLQVDSHPDAGTTFWIQFLVYSQERREAAEAPPLAVEAAPTTF